jgi:hypothetical protein
MINRRDVIKYEHMVGNQSFPKLQTLEIEIHKGEILISFEQSDNETYGEFCIPMNEMEDLIQRDNLDD